MAKIQRENIRGIPAIVLEAGGYRAAFCPDMGANCFLLEREGASYLRSPASYPEFRRNPNVFGIPLLFPPNRVSGGAFMFQGRPYRLPINEVERGNHIHGFLSSTRFVPFGEGADEHRCQISFAYEATRDLPYSTFPHEFRVLLEYSLGPEGLRQTLSVENRGALDMPLGLGFHTAFSCPFLPATAPGDYFLRLSAEREYPLDPVSFTPTGEIALENELLTALGGLGASLGGRALSNHLAGLSPPDGSAQTATLVHLPTGKAIAYRVDPLFGYWTLWNQGGSGGFVCVEPQTWIVDAPHSALPPGESGFRSLAAGQTLSLVSTLGEEGIALS